MFVKRPAVAASQRETSAPFEEHSPTAPLLPVPIVNSSGPLAPLDTRILTGGLVHPPDGSTLGRMPLAIKKELQRPEPLPPRSAEARRKHSKRLWILGTAMLLITLAATLLSFTSQGQELTAKFIGNQATADHGAVITNSQNNAAQVAALATTTWMYQNDGFDPFSHGEVNVSNGATSLPWPFGQCTYWANYRYHQLTGYWVQWTGNADQWFLGAQMAGWDYGQTPPSSVPSIIVLMPYVQEAGWLGHVAVVEGQTGNVVHTSNMNWGYGGSTHVEDVDFTLGAGVYFVWHKPAN